MKNDGHELGGYENGRRGFVGTGWEIDSLSDGWHRLTVSAGCTEPSCSTRLVIYYIDGAEVARTDYSSETDFFAIGNYQGGSQPWRSRLHHFRIYDEFFAPSDLEYLPVGEAIEAGTCPDSSCCSLDVLSADHSSGHVGQYFNFDLDAECIGQTGSVSQVNQYRGGALVWTGDVVTWHTANGGSSGSSHGRRDSGAAPGQWEAGDLICVLTCRPPIVDLSYPDPLVAVDVDDSGSIVVTGTSNVAATVQGSPAVVEGPSGELDAIQYGTGAFVQLGDNGVDTDNTWTIDCYIYSPMPIAPGRWGTFTRGRAGDHQIIVKNDGHELGGYENG
ncbi:MAG: hypothetical protein VXX04_06715, partial [Actinomycetota bacterium]|nr:hypothetical protein [Actinomycetota bacterium]